jgi:hypothetical protein
MWRKSGERLEFLWVLVLPLSGYLHHLSTESPEFLQTVLVE